MFIQVLSYFEGEAKLKLNSNEQSQAALVKISRAKIEINAIKTAILKEREHCDLSKLQDESTSTREESSDSLLGEMLSDDFLTTMMVNSIKVNQIIVGTKSSLTKNIKCPTQTSSD